MNKYGRTKIIRMNRANKTYKKKLPKNTKDLSILTGICNLILAIFPGEVKKIKLR